MELEDAQFLEKDDILRIVAELWYEGPFEKEFGIRYSDGNESWGNSPEYTIQKYNNYAKQGIATELLSRNHIGYWDPTENVDHLLDLLKDERFNNLEMTKIGEKFHVKLRDTTITHENFPIAILIAFIVEFGKK
ncbi:hypothetical protein [Paenibacillus periandrae]|uniref:hypothetical protein n=1 Tax=Paenibacillus periandrae TaxID=1761741 RepID=UPI001F08E2B7|nr:hypothetical protein [Paenibacillus periandrae]